MADLSIDESELRDAVNAACSCGGNGPGMGCGACDVWHYLHGNHWTNKRQPCEACEGRGTKPREEVTRAR